MYTRPHADIRDARFFVSKFWRGENISKCIIMDGAAAQCTVTKIAYEILRYNKGTDSLILLGIKTRDGYLTNRIQGETHQIGQRCIPIGTIDTTYFRDDAEYMPPLTTKGAIDIDTDITDKVVVIIDGVLYTGRAARVSLDTILPDARPIKIGLTALVDRGHRELLIRADFVGKNVPTSKEETASAYLGGMDQGNAVMIK